eukprot:gene8075-10938_t
MGCTTSTGAGDPKDAPESAGFKKMSNSYVLGEVLGEGGYSVVKEAIDKKTKKRYAAKIVNREGLDPDDELSLRTEVAILQKFHHTNIIKAFDFFEEEKQFYVILEYVDGGELFDRIVQRQFYNENEARNLVVILLNAIKYCHDRNVVHRDLKPENLLLMSKEDDADMKLADFGFAVQVDGDTITHQCGTPGYIAPEILEKKPYGKAVDMWSFGVILYILLGGYPPFHDENQKNLFRKILRCDYKFHPEFWSAVSDEAKDLIKGLLVLNPHQRLTVDQALAHPWLQKAAAELAARDLNANKEELRKTLAKQRWRKAFNTVRAANRFRMMFEVSHDSHDPIGGDGDEARPASST